MSEQDPDKPKDSEPQKYPFWPDSLLIHSKLWLFIEFEYFNSWA
jgi:hypothetical protein